MAIGDPNQPLADTLEYLRDLGFTDLSRDAVSGAAAEPVPGAEHANGAAPLDKAEAVDNAPPGADAGERAAALASVAETASNCDRCRLAGGRKTVVFGSGNPDADLMFVGEGPGAEEDRQGLPFVGPAGELLTKIIEAIGLARKDVYIANIVKCRPPGNRNPQPDEAAACREYLDRQIDLVRPKVLVALGRVAAHNLLDRDDALGRMRGAWYEVRGVPARVTYHPAALLRNVSYKRPTWEDMQIVRDRLKE